MLGNPTIIMLQSEKMGFAPASIDAPMEVFGVGVALAEVANSGGLMFAGSFQNCETLNPTFQVSTEPSFFLGERAGLLSNIQRQNDIQGHEELQIAIREEAFAPRFEPMRRGLELVIDDMDRLRVRGGRRPSLLDHLLESRHFGPEGLEAKDRRFSRATLVGKEEGAVVRQG